MKQKADSWEKNEIDKFLATLIKRKKTNYQCQE